MYSRFYLVIFLKLTFLVGCTAAGVPATNDPKEKIAYAQQLKELGRPIPAQKLLLESLSIYESNKDFGGLGSAYLALGNLYKSNTYQSNAEIFKKWNEYKSYKDSASYFDNSAENFLKAGDSLMAGMAKTGAGDAYNLANEMVLQCKSYAEAEELSKKAGSDTEILANRIQAFRNTVKCN